MNVFSVAQMRHALARQNHMGRAGLRLLDPAESAATAEKIHQIMDAFEASEKLKSTH